jgi:hypothetical protein
MSFTKCGTNEGSTFQRAPDTWPGKTTYDSDTGACRIIDANVIQE